LAPVISGLHRIDRDLNGVLCAIAYWAPQRATAATASHLLSAKSLRPNDGIVNRKGAEKYFVKWELSAVYKD
jgi:hypothetical protein